MMPQGCRQEQLDKNNEEHAKHHEYFFKKSFTMILKCVFCFIVEMYSVPPSLNSYLINLIIETIP